MISLDAAKVVAEIAAQRRARDSHLEGAAELLRRYPGSWWTGVPSDEGSNADAENASFEYLSYAMSQLVWENPRWRCTSRRPRAQQMVAEAIQHGLNRWTQDSDLKTVLQDLAVDYMFAWSVAHTTAAPLVESYEPEDAILWPQVSRISPWDFGFDHAAPTWRKARMLWHSYWIDKDDLIAAARKDREMPKMQRAGWSLKAIEELTPTQPKAGGGGKLRAMIGGAGEPDREQVELVQVYFPGRGLPGEPGPDQGFNGCLATYALSQSGDADGAVIVQRPRPFFGPRWGPYTVSGSYIVPDSAFPLSLLVATASHIAQSSRIAQAVDSQVAAYKRLMLVSNTDPKLAQIIKDGKSEHVYATQMPGDLAGRFAALEVGGTTAANVAAERRVLERRNRAMGMDDVQRGSVTGEGTATEVQHAVEAALGRQGYVRGRFQDGVRRIGRTVAWYLYHMDEVVFPLGPDAGQALGLGVEEEAWFHGGDLEAGSGAGFDDLGLELEPFSLERTSEAMLARRGAFLVQVAQLAPALPALQQAGADVRGYLDALGDANGMPHLSGLFPHLESVDLSQIQPTEAQPRMAKDAGMLGSFAPKGVAGAGRSVQSPEAEAFGALGGA